MFSEKIKSKKVSDLMTRNILTGHVTNSFTHTLRLFSEMTFHHLPIVDSEGKIIGMISSNDLLKELTIMLPLLKDTLDETINAQIDIADIMTPDPKFISPTASIQDAIDLFDEHHFHALPVVSEKGLVGIITSNDILSALR